MSVLWDPHQKLWNAQLAAAVRRLPRPVARPVQVTVVLVDSALLYGRAVLRRLPYVGRRSDLPLVYVDCGTHKRAGEVQWLLEWFPADRLRVLAFEASPEHYADAKRSLDGLPVELFNCALVGPDHVGSTVRLYSGAEETGLGDSLFAERGERFVDVPARRLSDVLLDHPVEVDLAGSAVVVRMNIEGAEQYVLADLEHAGLLGRVDGWYGMWDDLGKIDAQQDRVFRDYLAEHRVVPFTFNDRDLRHRLRRAAIRMDLGTSLRRAAPPRGDSG